METQDQFSEDVLSKNFTMHSTQVPFQAHLQVEVATGEGMIPLDKRYNSLRDIIISQADSPDEQIHFPKSLLGPEFIESTEVEWLSILNTGPTTKDIDLLKVVEGINSLLKTNNFSMIDSIFNSVEPKDNSPEILLALLRPTFMARSLLDDWSSLLRNVKSSFLERKLDADRILVGLFR